MDKVLNLQMSLFGSFINIKPETEIVIKLLTALKDEQFFPGSADIAAVDLKTGKMNIDSRMQMVSPDKTWSILFLPERIDFNYNYQEGGSSNRNIAELIAYANMLNEKVFGVFPATTGNRLALNCKLAYENLCEEETKKFGCRFTKPISVYGDKALEEWSVRFNARGDIEVEEGKFETCNRITEMMQIENPDNNEPNHNVILSMDVNTLPSNLSLRFKYDNLKYFSYKALDFLMGVISEVERG